MPTPRTRSSGTGTHQRRATPHRMEKEDVFLSEGKDLAARRTLYLGFAHLIRRCPRDKDRADGAESETDGTYGFRKSGGVWFINETLNFCWDRRLVMWMKAPKDSFLPFYGSDNRPLLFNGEALTEAAVCPLELVLRSTALFTQGFLLHPVYRRGQQEHIAEAKSWRIIAFFKFPSIEHPQNKVSGCITDQKAILSLLENNQRSHRICHAVKKEPMVRPAPTKCLHKRQVRKKVDHRDCRRPHVPPKPLPRRRPLTLCGTDTEQEIPPTADDVQDEVKDDSVKSSLPDDDNEEQILVDELWRDNVDEHSTHWYDVSLPSSPSAFSFTDAADGERLLLSLTPEPLPCPPEFCEFPSSSPALSLMDWSLDTDPLPPLIGAPLM